LQLNATTNLKPNCNPNLIPNPNLNTNPNSTPNSEDLNMVILGFYTLACLMYIMFDVMLY